MPEYGVAVAELSLSGQKWLSGFATAEAALALISDATVVSPDVADMMHCTHTHIFGNKPSFRRSFSTFSG
jgi:hypothetical protein